MLADTFGRPLRFRITAGQAHDITAAAGLLEGQKAAAILADKAYDSNDLRELIAGMKAEAVIPSKRNRKVFIPHDEAPFKHRNQIERCFGRLNCRRSNIGNRSHHFTVPPLPRSCRTIPL
jgi:transposase